MRDSRILVVSLFLFAFSFTLFALQSGDAIMYLNLAKDFVLKPGWATNDSYVYSLSNPPLIWTHEYLSFLLFYGAYTLAGPAGLILLKSILWSAAFLLVLTAPPRDKNISKLFLLFWILAVLAASFRFIERSSLISDVALIALTVFLINRDRLIKWEILGLSLGFALWAQFHPGFPLGFAMLGLWATHRTFVKRTWTLKENLWLLGPVAAPIIHPDGFEAWIYPLRFGLTEAAIFKKYNYEWLPSYHVLFRFAPETIAYWVLVALSAFILIRNRPWRDLNGWLAVFFIAVGCSAVRFIPWTAFALIVVLKPYFELRSLRTDLGFKSRIAVAALLIAIAVKNLLYGYSSSSGERLPEFRLDPKFFPETSVSFLLSHPIPGRLYNAHDFGSYLIWRGYRPIFHHGFMTDMEFYENDVMGVFRSRARFQELAAKYNWTMLLVEKNANFTYFYNILKDLPEWKIVAQDEASFLIYKLPP